MQSGESTGYIYGEGSSGINPTAAAIVDCDIGKISSEVLSGNERNICATTDVTGRIGTLIVVLKKEAKLPAVETLPPALSARLALLVIVPAVLLIVNVASPTLVAKSPPVAREMLALAPMVPPMLLSMLADKEFARIVLTLIVAVPPIVPPLLLLI